MFICYFYGTHVPTFPQLVDSYFIGQILTGCPSYLPIDGEENEDGHSKRWGINPHRDRSLPNVLSDPQVHEVIAHGESQNTAGQKQPYIVAQEQADYGGRLGSMYLADGYITPPALAGDCTIHIEEKTAQTL